MTLHQAFQGLYLDMREPTAADEVRVLRAWLTRRQEVRQCFSPETLEAIDAALLDLQIEFERSRGRTVEDLEAHRKGVAS